MPDLDDGPPGVDPLDADPDSKSALFGEVGRAASGIASGSDLRRPKGEIRESVSSICSLQQERKLRLRRTRSKISSCQSLKI